MTFMNSYSLNKEKQYISPFLSFIHLLFINLKGVSVETIKEREKEWGSEREEREKRILYPLVYFPNTCNK